jgi:hypothetical protein
MSDRAKESVETGVISKDATVKLDDPEAMKLIEQARVKVIPFLDTEEAAVLEDAVKALESSEPSKLKENKAALKALLVPHSYLF